MTEQKCKDCASAGRTGRPLAADFPGPRCYTHSRAFKKAQRARTASTRLERVYGLRPGEYEALKAAQGGRCAICQVATGATKALAVDHWHGHCTVCVAGGSCGAPRSIRGVLCGPCNVLIGRLGPEALMRAANYLLDPPAPAILRGLRNELP